MVTVSEFVNFTSSDLKFTHRSEFPLNIVKYKQFVGQANETIENDKASLNKIRKGVKTMYTTGIGHSQAEVCFSELLERLSPNENGDIDVEFDQVAAGLCKFAVVLRDLSSKYQQLMQNLNSLVVYPLEMFLKSDIKHDVKKPFEKAMKDYEIKAEKLKKDRLNALNKENASTIYKPNSEDPFDFSEDLERERRIVQLHLCEFLIKINEMKARKGAELVQQLIDYYRAQTNYFKDSLSMMEHMGLFMNDLVFHIDELKNKHSEDVQLLIGVRRELRSLIEKNKSVTGNQTGYSLHQPQGNKAYGTSKEGFLLKKSDGVVKRVWQKRRVKVCDQNLMLYHGDDSKPPVILPMLTCHIKTTVGGDSGDSLCFDLISNNRTYNFRVEDEKNLEEWLSVLSNAKAAVFEQAMSLDNAEDDSFSKDSNYSLDASSFTHNNAFAYNSNNPMISSTISFKINGYDGDVSPSHNRKAILKIIKKLDGNDRCADCDSPDPEWVSVNLGVLICLECCGVHRELGVHHSRTQSLKMDTFYISQLLLPRFVGNKLFNEIYEATLAPGIKPSPSDGTSRNDSVNAMQQRRSFIKSKYVDKKFVNKLTGDNKSYLKHDLLLAIQNFDTKNLLQAYGEGVELMSQFTIDDDVDIGSQINTSIHLALQLAEKQNEEDDKKRICMYDLNWDEDTYLKNRTVLLTVLEFILQNSPSSNLKKVNAKGDTILHQAVKNNQLDATKLILRSGVSSELITSKNNDNLTAPELAEFLNRKEFTDLFKHTINETDKDHHNEFLDELSVEWGFYANSSDNQHDKYSVNQIKQSDAKKSAHNRTESTSSNKSDASYVNFNHSLPVAASETPPQNPRKEHKSAYKSFLAFSPDQKIGIRTSANPWNEVATLPRKKSLKGPAPEPPLLKAADRKSSQFSIPGKQKSSTEKEKPAISPKPRSIDAHSSRETKTPQPKMRTKISNSAIADYPNATLPRNMHSNYKSVINTKSVFSPLVEPDGEDRSDKNCTVLKNSQVYHSSDHIDVLLDVLEEPNKPLNAKEVVHISKTQQDSPPKHQTQSDKDLTTGCRTIAKYNCEAENADELSFSKGETIVVASKTCEDGWWNGFIETDPSRSGMFPANFVQKL